MNRVGPAIGLGIGYGVFTTVALAVLWCRFGFRPSASAGAPSFPNIAISGTLVSLFGHVVFAISLALT